MLLTNIYLYLNSKFFLKNQSYIISIKLNSNYIIFILCVTYYLFQERVKAWQAFQALSMNLNKKREAKVKAELAQRMDKISILRQDILFYCIIFF